MIQHVYETSKKCIELDEVYVATDDTKIYSCVDGFGGKAIITKKDHISGTDRVYEAVEKIKIDDKDIVVNIQGDQPVFRPSIISKLISPLKDDLKIPMSTLMCKIQNDTDLQDINKVKVVIDRNYNALYFSRLPIPFARDENVNPVYYKHIGVYAYRKKFLYRFTKLPYGLLENSEKLEQLRAIEHGFKIRMVETFYDSIEVDLPENIMMVEKIFSKK